jgi:ketosteroid isomerase-like protein
MSSDQGSLDTGTFAESVLESLTARRFVTALRTLEQDGDLDEMVRLGTDDTRWWSVGSDGEAVGSDAARQFWTKYRRAFAEIASDFTTVTETPTRVLLEWTSHGRHHNGAPVRYAGATVLEFGDPSDDETLTGVRLYFDTAATMIRSSEPGADGAGDDGGMLDAETEASGENNGLAAED